MPLANEHAKCQICHRTETKNRTDSGRPICMSCDVTTTMPRQAIKRMEDKLTQAIYHCKKNEYSYESVKLTPDELQFLLEAYVQLEQKVINRRRQEVVKELYKCREERQRLNLRISDLEKVLDDLKSKGFNFSAIESSK